MVNSILTTHANKRCQQRGIKTEVLDCVRRYGDEYYSTNGCIKYQLNKRSLKDAFAEHNYSKQVIDKASKVYVITSGENEITWAHRTKKHYRNFKYMRDCKL